MSDRMRALSVQQPYLSAIILADKRTENRTWPAPAWVIGEEVALHASKTPDWHAPLYAWIAAGLKPPELTGVTRARWRLRNAGVLGAVLAVATVAGCHHASETGACRCGQWAAARQFHWVLDGVRPLAVPVPCSGALQLWPVPADVEDAVRAQLDGGGHRPAFP